MWARRKNMEEEFYCRRVSLPAKQAERRLMCLASRLLPKGIEPKAAPPTIAIDLLDQPDLTLLATPSPILQHLQGPAVPSQEPSREPRR